MSLLPVSETEEKGFLDPVTRKQLEEGDWDVQLSGGVLDVTKLKYFTAGEFSQRVRYWDLAATEQKEGVDPDWTAGHEDHAPDLAAGVGVPVPLPRPIISLRPEVTGNKVKRGREVHIPDDLVECLEDLVL